MTKAEYIAAATAGIGAILTNPAEVTDDQKRACIDQWITNLNQDTVNPDKATHPVIKG